MHDPYYSVFSAYRAGIIRKSGRGDSDSDSSRSLVVSREIDFDFLAFNAFMGLSSPRERFTCSRATRTSFRGLMAARAGEYEEAKNKFDHSWELSKEIEAGPCRTRATGFIEANVAYLEHCLGFPDRARIRVTRALDAALSLERDYGISLYQMHRIQLGHNLARVEWKIRNFQKAFELAGRLIAYLEGRCRDLPYHHDWLPDRLVAVPRDIIRRMMMQIAGEAVDRLLDAECSIYWKTFLESSMLPRNAEELRFFDRHLWLWLRGRSRRLEGDVEDYFETLESVLPAGPGRLGTLFYSFMIDFVDHCSTANSSSAKRVHAAILSDSAKWKSFPASMARKLASLPPVELQAA